VIGEDGLETERPRVQYRLHAERREGYMRVYELDALAYEDLSRQLIRRPST